MNQTSAFYGSSYRRTGPRGGGSTQACSELVRAVAQAGPGGVEAAQAGLEVVRRGVLLRDVAIQQCVARGIEDLHPWPAAPVNAPSLQNSTEWFAIDALAANATRS